MPYRLRRPHRCLSPVKHIAGSLIAASALIGAWAQAAPEAKDPTLAREILRELIDTRSTHDVGTTELARKVQARLLAAGFDPADAQLLIPADHPRAGNVVARLHGSGKGKPVLYLCHLDVVAANPEDWTRDPFHLTEDNGWLYGRGTIDMKGQDAAVLTALLRLKSEHFTPERDIIVAFTADEESGGERNGVDWLLSEHHDLVDAGLVINPDGGEAGMKAGRRLYIGVQTSEKISMAFEAEVTDKGGHSSRPTADNPIYRLSEGLTRLWRSFGFRHTLPIRPGSISSAGRPLRRAESNPTCSQRARAALIRRRSSGFRPRSRRISCCEPPARRPRSMAATHRTHCLSARGQPCSAGSSPASRRTRCAIRSHACLPIQPSRSAS